MKLAVLEGRAHNSLQSTFCFSSLDKTEVSGGGHPVFEGRFPAPAVPAASPRRRLEVKEPIDGLRWLMFCAMGLSIFVDTLRTLCQALALPGNPPLRTLAKHKQ